MKNQIVNQSVSDFHLDCWKSANFVEDERVGRCINERVARDASPDMVKHVAVARYFEMLEKGRRTLRGVFTAEDIHLLLHAHPHSWLPESSWGASYPSLADAIYEEYINRSNASDAAVELHDKILKLDVVQLLALTDVLECAWRSSDGPIAYALEAIGMN